MLELEAPVGGSNWANLFHSAASGKGLHQTCSTRRLHHRRGLPRLPGLAKLVSLRFEQGGFHGCGAAKPPQQSGQAQHQCKSAQKRDPSTAK